LRQVDDDLESSAILTPHDKPGRPRATLYHAVADRDFFSTESSGAGIHGTINQPFKMDTDYENQIF
jgi:hypothetical protein